MQLIAILLATVSILTFLSGFIVFAGSSKGDRIRSAWYFIAAIFATIWMISISLFLTATPESSNVDWHIKWTFSSAILLDAAFLGYISWKEKYGKIVTVAFLIFGLIISGFIFSNPEYLYSEVFLSNTGNNIILNIAPLYFAYNGFFATIVPAIVFLLFRQFYRSTSKRKRRGDIITMTSFGISSVITLIFNLILPILGNWNLVWLGPLALAITILSIYYVILRYRMLNLSSIWLRIFSYIVILASLAIVYMVIFSIVFASLFRGSTPSMEVIILNFIMILIFLCLVPAVNRLFNFMNRLIKSKKIDS